MDLVIDQVKNGAVYLAFILAKSLVHFLEAMQRLSQERLRDGAYAWGVVEHTGDPERVMEWFFVESWAEHLRQHKRVTNADADVQRALARYQIDGRPPVVEHFLTLGAR